MSKGKDFLLSTHTFLFSSVPQCRKTRLLVEEPWIFLIGPSKIFVTLKNAHVCLEPESKNRVRKRRQKKKKKKSGSF